MKKGLTINIITIMLVCALNAFLVLTILTNHNNHSTFAQTPNGTNQTSSEITSQPEISVLEKMIVPAQKTTVTANQTTLSVSPQALRPVQDLENQTQTPNP